jgi:hypothetical protein
LFDNPQQADELRSVATAGAERVAELLAWDEVIAATEAAIQQGCNQVAFNPYRLHMKEQRYCDIVEFLRSIRQDDS